jgi:uncharacterized protein (DUF362 family)/NAD-dependent dihydropyrimidine dehydrogenase PreA subunit
MGLNPEIRRNLQGYFTKRNGHHQDTLNSKETNNMHKVMIHPAEYHDCSEAINLALSLFPLKIKGKKVLVKPNSINGSEPDQGAVTHPSILETLLKKLEQSMAAEIIVGDNPGAMEYGDNEETFRRNGLMEAAGKYYKNIGSEAIDVEVSSQFFNHLSVSKDVLDADIFISLPKFKTHGLTIISGAIKNSYGILPGAQKGNGHRIAGNPARFHDLIVDVFGRRVPDLFIVGAVMGMEGNGPVSKDLRYIGQVMASDNAVALDATIARMMGLNPANLGFLEYAKKQGYGDYANEAVEIIGNFTIIPDFKLPPSAEGKGRELPPDFKEMTQRLTSMRPSADQNLCLGCGICVEKCPVSALSMINDLPNVTPEECIVCFCCQENCPERAIQLR